MPKRTSTYRTGDDMDFVAVKPGTAKIRCYVYGKNKNRYGDTIKVSVTEAKKDYSLRKSGSVKYEKVWDDFDLEEQQRSPAAILIPRMKKNRLCIR